MVDEGTEPPDVTFEFSLPPEWEVGVYANTVNVWHSPYEFTLDWAVTQPIEPRDPEDPSAGLRVPASVVARVRVPVGLIFDVLRTLNEAMTGYESIFGEIGRPEPNGRTQGDEPRSGGNPA